jgi:hypothetical protein
MLPGMDSEQGRDEAAGDRRGTLGGQARLVMNLLMVTALLVGFAIWWDVSQVTALSRAEAERIGGADGATSGADGFGGGIEAVEPATPGAGNGVATLITMLDLATNIAFLVWFRRAYFHPALPAERLRFRRGLVVLSWFVPILNLIRPKQIMDDVWRASDPALLGSSAVPARKPVSMVVHMWWALWLVGTAFAFAESPLAGGTATAETLAGAVTYLVSDLVALGVTVATFLLVRQVTRRVEARATALAA